MTQFEYEIAMAYSQKALNGESTEECTEYQNSAKWCEVNENDIRRTSYES